jgi:hypothetical protein
MCLRLLWTIARLSKPRAKPTKLRYRLLQLNPCLPKVTSSAMRYGLYIIPSRTTLKSDTRRQLFFFNLYRLYPGAGEAFAVKFELLGGGHAEIDDPLSPALFCGLICQKKTGFKERDLAPLEPQWPRCHIPNY